MARRLAAALGAATLIAVLAGCAAGSTGSGTASSGGPSPSGAVTATAPPSAAPATSAAPTPTTPAPRPTAGGPTGGELTLTGQVEQGAEPGCLILRSGGRTYELMTGDRTVVRAGAQVVVTGHVVTGMMSHCMQGQLFQVTSARRG
jgi:hypothetical protein